jgi:SAM-dependent methyltransferase
MKVDYGLDAPGVVRGFAVAGVLLAIATVLLVVAGLPFAPELFGLGAAMFLATVAAMIHSSRRGKLIERDRLLDGLGLAGDEDVLDVGCGRGLLLLGAAKRLPRGRAVGIDLWSATDQSDNRREATLANAEAEGGATEQYAHALEDAGLVDVARSGRSLRMYPSVRVVTARAPDA